MGSKLYVGNLSYDTDESGLAGHVEAAGFKVVSAKIITDRETKRPRGFAFVEIESPDAAEAISALDGKELDGRALRISEARERTGGDRGPPRGGDRSGG